MTESLLHRIRHVVVVASSPRGGSSLLAERLRSCPELLHLPGETPPLLTLAGLDPLELTGCESLGPAEAARFGTELAQQFGAEIGNPGTGWNSDELSVWLLRRLSMQWPAEEFEIDEVRHWVRSAESRAPAPSRLDEFSALTDFHLEFIAAVRAAHPAVNPYYYDIAEDAVAARFPGLPVPQGPPSPRLVEVPPFLISRPWRLAELAAGDDRPLVIKAPGCAYQIPFYRALFPQAHLRVLHLTRAPGPSIHGLLRAWEHRGFFSRRVPVDLAITGYSDVHPGWGEHWWNFDLPPGWTDLVKDPLAAVCAFQWHSAHRAALEATAAAGLDVLTLRHEDFVGTRRQRQAATRTMGEWLGLSGAAIDVLTRTAIAPVSAVATPDENRWLAARDIVVPQLRSPQVREISAALGYDDQAFAA